MVRLYPFKDPTPEEKKEIFSFHPQAPVGFYMQKVYEALDEEYHHDTLNSYVGILEETLKGLRTRIWSKEMEKLDSNYARARFTSIPIEHLNPVAEEKFVDTLKRCVRIRREVMNHTNNGEGMSDEKLIQAFFAFAKEGPYQLPKTHRYILGGSPQKNPNSLAQQRNGAASMLVKILMDFVPRDLSTAHSMWNREKWSIEGVHKDKEAQRAKTGTPRKELIEVLQPVSHSTLQKEVEELQKNTSDSPNLPAKPIKQPKNKKTLSSSADQLSLSFDEEKTEQTNNSNAQDLTPVLIEPIDTNDLPYVERGKNAPGAGYTIVDGDILPPNVSNRKTRGKFRTHDDSPFD